jgi:hypothetical protein
VGGFANGVRCFDLISCTSVLCGGNETEYRPQLASCGSAYADFLNRTPGWQQSSYRDFSSDLTRLLFLICINPVLFFFLPLVSFLLEKIEVTGFILRIVSRVSLVLLIIIKITTFTVVQSFLLSFDDYKPVLPDWFDYQLVLLNRLVVGILLVQEIGSLVSLIFNHLTEIDSTLTEFEPLAFRSTDAIIYTPDDENETD